MHPYLPPSPPQEFFSMQYDLFSSFLTFIITLRLCFRKGSLRITQSYTILFIYKSPFPILREDVDYFLQSYSRRGLFCLFVCLFCLFVVFFLWKRTYVKVILLVINLHSRTSEMSLFSHLYLPFSIFNIFIMIFSCWSSIRKGHTTGFKLSCCYEYHYQWRYIFWMTLKSKINNEKGCKMHY